MVEGMGPRPSPGARLQFRAAGRPAPSPIRDLRAGFIVIDVAARGGAGRWRTAPAMRSSNCATCSRSQPSARARPSSAMPRSAALARLKAAARECAGDASAAGSA